MIQTKIGAQQDFKHLIQVSFHFHSREPLKNPQNTNDHIEIYNFCPFLTLIFHPLSVNKKAYILKQTCS